MGVLLGLIAGGWLGLLAVVAAAARWLLRLYVAWRYQRRLKRMIEQLPQLLDHTVRSLKSGRTLADAVLGAIDAAEDPLKNAMGRVQRNVQLGVSLPDAASDFAELYEQDELRLFALGLKVNHRYGGNASELLENLIKMIREREQARSPVARHDRRNPGHGVGAGAAADHRWPATSCCPIRTT